MLSKWHLLPLALMEFGDSYLLIQEYQWISLKVLRVREMEIRDSTGDVLVIVNFLV